MCDRSLLSSDESDRSERRGPRESLARSRELLRNDRESRPFQSPPTLARSRRRPMGSAPVCPASPVRNAARRSRWLDAVPIRLASASDWAKAALSSGEIAFENRRVGVDAAIAEEWPVAPDGFNQ